MLHPESFPHAVVGCLPSEPGLAGTWDQDDVKGLGEKSWEKPHWSSSSLLLLQSYIYTQVPA